MNKKLRGILIAVAVLSFAVALYAPVSRFFENKSLDDEMDALRRMKQQGAEQVKDTAPPPATIETDQGLELGMQGAPLQVQPSADPRIDATAQPQVSGTAGENMVDGSAIQAETDQSLGAKSQDAPLQGQPSAGMQINGISQPQAPGATGGDIVDGSVMQAKTDQSLGDIYPEVNLPNGSAAQVTNVPALVEAFGISSGTQPDSSIDGSVTQQSGSVDIAQRGASAAPDVSAGAILTTSAPEQGKPAVADPIAAIDPAATEASKQDSVGIDASAGIATAGPLEPGQVPDASIGLPEHPTLEPTSEPTPESTPEPTPEPTPAPTPFVFDEAKILPEYKELYEANNDLVGWLAIDGTIIDYPVLQSEDDEFYLARDYYGQKNYNGQLILDTNADPFTPSMNLVISGHNMNSGKMFGKLQSYASKDYARRHSTIQFDTLFRKGEYKVVAAFYTWDHTVRADGFKYNVNIEYKLELRDFLRQLDAIKLYDTGVSVEFGDELIMLSTCSYQTSDGRFVVVARRLREGEES